MTAHADNSTVSRRLQVFYDGACPLCSREIAAYRRQDAQGRVEWVDISGPDFNAAACGLDPARVQAVMHVRTPDGAVHTELAAFREIWRALPGKYLTLVLLVLTGLPGVRGVAGWAYRAFARNRYWLTGRKFQAQNAELGTGESACAEGACGCKVNS